MHGLFGLALLAVALVVLLHVLHQDRPQHDHRVLPTSPARPSHPSADILCPGTLSGPGHRHAGGYAALALLTTGYAPMKDAIVEVAAITLDPAGRPTETYHTLVRPDDALGDGPMTTDALGTVDPHDLTLAPAFAQVAPTLLDLLAGRVIVSLHPGHVGQFLAAQFLRAGTLPPRWPSLPVTRGGPGLFGTPNVRTATLARRLQVPYPMPPTAVDQARVAAACVPPLLERFGETLRYPCPPPEAVRGESAQPSASELASQAPDGRSLLTPGIVITDHGVRPAHLRRRPPATLTPPAFLADLLAATPLSVQEMNDARVAAYLEDVTTLLVSGRLVQQEINGLGQRLARAGASAESIRAISGRLCESLRQAAFHRPQLSTTQLRHLRACATSLGVAGYFDDLIPPPTPPAPAPNTGSFARPVRKPLPPPPPPKKPRCGICLRVGHYTAMCPAVGRRAAGAIEAVEPTGRMLPAREVGPIRPI